MTTLSFGGVTIQCYQASDYAYDVQTKATRLYSGEQYVNISSLTPSIFPRSFLCHTDAASEITAIAAKIGSFGNLVLDGTTYANCYISSMSAIKELIAGSGKYSFSISFGKADHY
jgi:hypothetical protein